MNKLKKFLTVSLVTGAFLVPALVICPKVSLAASTSSTTIVVPGGGLENPTVQSPTDFIDKIIRTALAILAGIAVLFIIYGGFQYITGKSDDGKKNITYAVVGLIIILLSYGLVKWVISVFIAA